MNYLYSPSTRGFYAREINDVIPEDAVEITVEEHTGLLAAQSAGKIISPGADGRPVALDRVVTDEELAAAARRQRDELLLASDWSQLRDVPDSVSTPWSVYRQALRDITEQDGFPSSITWPVAPQ